MKQACAALPILLVFVGALYAADPGPNVVVELPPAPEAMAVDHCGAGDNLATTSAAAYGRHCPHRFTNVGTRPCCPVDFGPLWANYCSEKHRGGACGPSHCAPCQPLATCPQTGCGCGHHRLLGRSTWRRLRHNLHMGGSDCCDHAPADSGCAAPTADVMLGTPELGEPPEPGSAADVPPPAPPAVEDPSGADAGTLQAPANRSSRRTWLQQQAG
jgi:hypothetical protein